ncbi:MAG TPA: thioredoxin domain-containing protein [Longimicrobiales bacterium]
MNRTTTLIPLRPRARALAAAVALAGATLGAAGPLPAQQPDDVLARAAASRARGAQDAPVLVFEIADFQCPYCARFSRDVFPRLDSAFVRSGQVQWVFVNLPLPSLHPRAWAAAEAALCAGGVADGFWSFHDRLFAAQDEWSAADDPHDIFVRYAREADIPVEPFEACILGDGVASLLLEDIVFAASARVSGTPTFVIDRETVVVGLKSFEEWSALLEEAIRKKAGAGRR